MYKLFVAFSETSESVMVLKGPQGRINRAVWGPLNRTILSGGEDAIIRIWDTEVRDCRTCDKSSDQVLLLVKVVRVIK